MDTEQLKFWTTEFGEQYINRNLADHNTLASRFYLWTSILRTLQSEKIESILEVGSNIGLNLRTLKFLTDSELYAIEPFEKALNECVSDGIVEKNNAYLTSAFETDSIRDNQIDLVFTSGVLIHIHPKDLKKATDNVVRIAKKYVVCVEYFSDKEEEICYRGHQERLFKRDFGSFYLDNYPELKLRDHGFAWKRATGLDNLTWWLFEKK